MDLVKAQKGTLGTDIKYQPVFWEISNEPDVIDLNSTLVDLLDIKWLRILGVEHYARTSEILPFAKVQGCHSDITFVRFALSIGLFGEIFFSYGTFGEPFVNDVNFTSPLYKRGNNVFYDGPACPIEPPWLLGGGYLVAKRMMHDVKSIAEAGYDGKKYADVGELTEHILVSLAIVLYDQCGDHLIQALPKGLPGNIPKGVAKTTDTESRLIEHILNINKVGTADYIDSLDYLK